MIKFRVLYFHNLCITHNENNPLSQNSNQLEEFFQKRYMYHSYFSKNIEIMDYYSITC